MNWDKLIIKNNNHIEIEVNGEKLRGERDGNYFNFNNHQNGCTKLFGPFPRKFVPILGVDYNCYWPAGAMNPIDFAIYHFKKYHKGKLIDFRTEF